MLKLIEDEFVKPRSKKLAFFEIPPESAHVSYIPTSYWRKKAASKDYEKSHESDDQLETKLG